MRNKCLLLFLFFFLKTLLDTLPYSAMDSDTSWESFIHKSWISFEREFTFHCDQSYFLCHLLSDKSTAVSNLVVESGQERKLNAITKF